VRFCGKGAFVAAVVLVAAFELAGCGYRIAGSQNLLPKTIHTIAVPPFDNATIRYKLTDLLPEDIDRELISRTKYQIIPDASQADAVLHGTVISYAAYPTLIDQSNGRTSALQVIVRLSVNLTDRSNGKVLFTRPSYEAHERYEAAVTNNYQYFDESTSAVQRLSKDVARDLVSSILDNF
jgi:Lipopolysaccharide-assembly